MQVIAIITSAHALRGHVKLKCLVQDYLSLYNYSPLHADDKSYHLDDMKLSGKSIIAKFKGIDSREQAEALHNVSLYTDASKLPQLHDDEYYYNDLINMQVILPDNSCYGKITNVYDFGAGEVVKIEIHASQQTIILPFNKECFPSVNKSKAEATLILPDII